MNTRSIKLLKFLLGGDREIGDLSGLLGVESWQLGHLIKDLGLRGFVERHGTVVRLANTPKTILLRDVAKAVNIEKLLRRSNDVVLLHLVEPSTIGKLVQKTGLSQTSVYRSIADFQSIGAVKRDGKTLQINRSIEPLAMFARLLSMERDNVNEEGGGIETIYHDGLVTLWKTPLGKNVKDGVATGFTVFSNHDFEYRPVNNYFCRQDDDLDMHDILLHAVYAASYSKNPPQLLACMVFYAKYKDKMDIQKLRKKSTMLGISKVWLDIESYMHRLPLVDSELFLPWQEFVAKAELYDVKAENYTLPKPDNLLFKEIGDALQKPMTAYLFGGENMRLKLLKDSTKDCDIVVRSKDDFDRMASVLDNMGYVRKVKTTYADEDLRIRPDDIFLYEHKSRIDLFTHTILQNLTLSPNMMYMADILDYGTLKIGLLRNEHVFLLKAVACREGDIHDMESLVRGRADKPDEPDNGHFDWDIVWRELLQQEKINPVKEFTNSISDQLVDFTTRTGILVPFASKLRRRLIDRFIIKLIFGYDASIREIVDLLRGADVTEPIIRSRIDSLAKSAIIKKYLVGRTVHVKLLQNNEFARPEQDVKFHRLKRYFEWRFMLRAQPTDRQIQDFEKELGKLGLEVIGHLDEIMRSTIGTLQRYERDQFSRRRLGCIDVARACIGMRCDSLGNDPDSKFFIREFPKYRRMAEEEHSLSFTPQKWSADDK